MRLRINRGDPTGPAKRGAERATAPPRTAATTPTCTALRRPRCCRSTCARPADVAHVGCVTRPAAHSTRAGPAPRHRTRSRSSTSQAGLATPKPWIEPTLLPCNTSIHTRAGAAARHHTPPSANDALHPHQSTYGEGHESAGDRRRAVRPRHTARSNRRCHTQLPESRLDRRSPPNWVQEWVQDLLAAHAGPAVFAVKGEVVRGVDEPSHPASEVDASVVWLS